MHPSRDLHTQKFNFNQNEKSHVYEFEFQDYTDNRFSASFTTDFTRWDDQTEGFAAAESRPLHEPLFCGEETFLDQISSYLRELNTNLFEVFPFYLPDDRISSPRAPAFEYLNSHSGTEELPDKTIGLSALQNDFMNETLSTGHLIGNYPQFHPLNLPNARVDLHIFEIEEEKIDRPVAESEFSRFDRSSTEPNRLPANRQRRLTTYVWEMSDFSDYASNNTNDYFNLTGWSGDDLKIVLKPLSSGGVAAGTDENGSASQGVATNMPVYPNSGIWSPSTRTYNDFLKITGSLPTSITIDASAMKYYMNWYYGDWDISTADVSANHYDLIYYSAVPEPSTYFMTGALFVLIGTNRNTRKLTKVFVQKRFLKASPKKIEIS
ncbi:MAG: hypothetical protein VW576_05040 [Opitutae bacterium]